MKTEHFKVKFYHYNTHNNRANPNSLLNKFRGREVIEPSTGVKIYNNKGELLAVGLAVCSFSDNFCKAVGRKIALERALKSSDLSQKDKEEIIQAHNQLPSTKKLNEKALY